MVAGVLLSLAAALGGCRVEEIVPIDPEPAAPVAPEPKPKTEPGLDIEMISYKGQRFTVCTVDLTKRKIELFWRDGSKQPFLSFDGLDKWLRGKGRKLLFATNAGMFREDFAPVGLYVEHRTKLRPLNLRDGSSNFCMKPNGVFAITDSGAKVVESSKYPRIKQETIFATQSGPMLVIDGEIHPDFRAKSESRLFRNGVGVASPERVVVAITEDPVNLYEFAVLFRDRLECPNALYLDGNISSLYSAQLGRNDYRGDIGPILAVTGEL